MSTSNPTIILSVNNLQVKAGNKTLLRTTHEEFSEGEFWAIVGANGAGKSTFLKAISGDNNYTGDILLHGKELRQWDSMERARHVGVLPQSSILSFAFKAKEVVELGLTPLSLSREQAEQVVNECMRRCDCLHLADEYYPQLSGGEQQRVNLARVLVQISQAKQTPILLLDEALSAQDLGHQHQLLEFVTQLCNKQNILIVGVLHDLNHVLKYCDKALLIDQGKAVQKGNVEKVLNAENIERCWRYRAEFITSSEGHKLII
ncbi:MULTISPECIES: heme ABC transporter ATP-binding protein [unclassified Oleiphilus]|nr:MULTISPECIES: heme ABC transporter ATP-binding protein [unclassified Oleiphilus]